MRNNIKRFFVLIMCITLVFGDVSFTFASNKGTEDIKAPTAASKEKTYLGGVNGGTENIVAPEMIASDNGRLYTAKGTIKEEAINEYNKINSNIYSDRSPINAFGNSANIGVSPSGNINISTAQLSDNEVQTIVIPGSIDKQGLINIKPIERNVTYYDVAFNKNEISASAKSAILVNTTNGKIYYGKDYDKTFLPAGLVNLMTAYVAIQNKGLDDVLTVNSEAVANIDKDASIAALAKGDTITLRDAIGAMFVKGCVDCANVIAENVSGSKNEFVNLMNETAKLIGCKNTVFKNPSGLDDDGQVSTAYDIALLMDRITDNQEIVSLMSVNTYTLPKSKKRDSLILYSKNTMLSKDSSNYNKDMSCSRLGYTTKAEYNIASEFIYKDNKFVIVVLNAKGTQFSDTKKLYEYAKKAFDEGK